MQHIGVSLINERHEIQQRSKVNYADVANVFLTIQECEEKYPFLAGIDNYGHTYFNVYQAPKIIEELEKLKQEEVAKKIIKEIDDTIGFLKKVEQHTFAWFTGD